MNDKNNINVYPNPPKHYKNFANENSLQPPDLNFLNKIDSFMCFGKEYKTREILNFKNSVELNFVKFYDKKVVESKNIPNQNIFNLFPDNLTEINFDTIIENSHVNILECLNLELNFLRKSYIELLNQIKENIEDSELSNCLIKFSFQKIYYLISVLKRKQIFIESINYFKNEIENNTKIENLLVSNVEKCQITLSNGIKKLKEESEYQMK